MNIVLRHYFQKEWAMSNPDNLWNHKVIVFSTSCIGNCVPRWHQRECQIVIQTYTKEKLDTLTFMIISLLQRAVYQQGSYYVAVCSVQTLCRHGLLRPLSCIPSRITQHRRNSCCVSSSLLVSATHLCLYYNSAVIYLLRYTVKALFICWKAWKKKWINKNEQQVKTNEARRWFLKYWEFISYILTVLFNVFVAIKQGDSTIPFKRMSALHV